VTCSPVPAAGRQRGAGLAAPLDGAEGGAYSQAPPARERVRARPTAPKELTMAGVPPTVQRISTEPEPFAANRISPGFRVGDLVYTSGQVAVTDTGDGVVGVGDFDAQLAQVFEHLDTILRAGGSGLDRVIKVTIYLTDMKYLPNVVAARSRYFSEPYPASTMIEVSALALPDLLVEIEAVAVAAT
jgi:reactive intermediate/imine deaminase